MLGGTARASIAGGGAYSHGGLQRVAGQKSLAGAGA